MDAGMNERMNATDIDRAQKGPGGSRQGAVSPEAAAKGVHSRIAVRVRVRTVGG